MALDATQRHYRAPCPGCGAPVVFQSAQATHAVCAYCHSMVVRSGGGVRGAGGSYGGYSSGGSHK